ncbi:MAG TPA: LptF/LptG family permease [Tepidisphaeraceae bacterium]|jgi:lipopolysaccharide export LptBFGC system permease protein LptF
MKILDRYVLTTFLKNYLISFFVLVGLYVVLDMIFNFDDFTRIQAEQGQSTLESLPSIIFAIGEYYFYQMFLFFLFLSGIIPVVAAAFTLMRFSRFNELVAILAAGRPLLRVALPIIFAGLVLNGLVIIDQEVLIPGMIPKLTRDRREAGTDSAKAYPIQSMQDENRALLVVGRYVSGPTTPAMENITLIARDENLSPVARLTADAATWDAQQQQWQLTNGLRLDIRLTEGRRPEPERVAVYKSDISPETIALYRSRDFVRFLSTERISELINTASYGRVELLRVKHTRFTQPILNFILLLLAIPCVMTREPGRLKSAALRCVILMALCLGTVFITQQLAGNPPPEHPDWTSTWPALWAWIPVFVFGPLAVYLLDGIKT